MLARNMVIQHGSQPISLVPTDIHDGYRIADGSILILYALKLQREGCSIRNWGDDEPILAYVKADDFLVNQPYYDAAERPIVAWMVERAREIIDRKISEHNWSIRLSDAGSKQYFNVHIECDKPTDIHARLLHNSNFLWSCFIPTGSEEETMIEEQYVAEAA